MENLALTGVNENMKSLQIVYEENKITFIKFWKTFIYACEY